MAKSSDEPIKISLRLLIDEEKNKVVLAEAGKDFVEVLSDLLNLPMGTIVRLLEKHHQIPKSSSIVGCFHNLYKSVSVMNVDNFHTQAFKNLLLYPKSIKEARHLKLNVEEDAEVAKYFVCPQFSHNESCCKAYSNVSTLSCSHCGNVMRYEVQFQEREKVDGYTEAEAEGDFLSLRTSFLITDDLKVALNSMGHVLNVLNDLGYVGFGELREMVLDVGFEEVLTLLGCFFTSETPLTDTFLRKHCVTRKRKMLTPLVQDCGVHGEEDGRLVTLKVFVRKVDKTILYAECREDFVDFLFTFLAIPLEFAWELSIDNANMGCVGNLCRSFKGLSFENDQKEATVSKCILPHYYNARAQLLDVVFQEPPEFEYLVSRNVYNGNMFSKKIKKTLLAEGKRIGKLISVDSESKHTSDSVSNGLVKAETKFILSDDLVVTPMNSSSTISLLSKLQMSINDIEERVISIGKAEATCLLRASLITTSALTNGFSYFLSKMKPEEETTQSTKKIPKSEKTC